MIDKRVIRTVAAGLLFTVVGLTAWAGTSVAPDQHITVNTAGTLEDDSGWQ